MFISKHIYFVILIINLYKCTCEISDKRLCVDDDCSGKKIMKTKFKCIIIYYKFSSPDITGKNSFEI